MKKTTYNFIAHVKRTLINGLFVFMVFYAIQFTAYWFLPFDFFVAINRQSYKDEVVGSKNITMITNRTAIRDITATGIKEIYFVADDKIPNQLPGVIHTSFSYEKDMNDKDFEITFDIPKEFDKPGNYYVNDTITLNLPFGIEKTKTFPNIPFTIQDVPDQIIIQ